MTERQCQIELEAECVFEEIFGMLWNEIVEPVLDHLGYHEGMPHNEELPRVTWHFTGPLLGLPLHAAGWYKEPLARIYNYVVSSYSPNLTPVLSRKPLANKIETILVFGSGTANGRASQSGVAEEPAWVKRQRSGELVTELGDKDLAPQRVLAEMQKHNWVHLACIPVSYHERTPSVGGTIFMLRSSDVAQSDIVQGEPLPFVHGMIMAGYSAIITALWSLRAQDASVVTQQVYARLRHGENREDVRVVQVPHAAVGHLRAEVGEKAFIRWIPYIHVGQ
ncbi:hypothetical protein FRC12_019107 [Ceratobasidium sp. 428]|nr:hypothetical protein FRC12_019107 [Ceratobasidium sp. 428]